MRRIWNLAPALGLVAGLAAGSAPLAASAQSPSYATDVETIRGTISALPGKYALTLADTRGFSDNVSLHDGTVIAPAVGTLQVGEEIAITGHADGPAFDADSIDLDSSDTYDTGSGSGAYVAPYAGIAYPPYVLPYGFGYGFGYGSGYYGYGYPTYPGYYSCCFTNPGTNQSPPGRKGTSPSVPVGGGHTIPLPHPIRVQPPSGSSSTRSSYGGSRSTSSSGGSRRR